MQLQLLGSEVCGDLKKCVQRWIKWWVKRWVRGEEVGEG